MGWMWLCLGWLCPEGRKEGVPTGISLFFLLDTSGWSCDQHVGRLEAGWARDWESKFLKAWEMGLVCRATAVASILVV